MRCTLLFCHNTGHTNGIFFLQFFQRNIRNTIFINASDDPGAQDIMDAYDMIFSGKSKTELEKLKLDFKDLIIVVQEAVQLISGVEEPAGGEQ